MSVFPAWESDKETVNPQGPDLEGHWDLIIGLPQYWGRQRVHSWRAQTKSYMHQDPGEISSDPTGD